MIISRLLDNLVQFLSMPQNEENNSAFRKGVGLEKLLDFLTIVFVGNGNEVMKEKILYSFKVYIEPEEIKEKKTTNKQDVWISTKTTSEVPSKQGKVINYWCFNPGFG